MRIKRKIYAGTVDVISQEKQLTYHFHANDEDDADRILRALFFEDMPEYRGKSGQYEFSFTTSVHEVVLRKPRD